MLTRVINEVINNRFIIIATTQRIHTLTASQRNSTVHPKLLSVMVRLTVPIADLRFHRSADILNDGEQFVSISEMSQEDFVSSVNDVVVAQILYIKKKKDESVFSKSRGTSEKNLSFERLLM